jgi:hypothetical protein
LEANFFPQKQQHHRVFSIRQSNKVAYSFGYFDKLSLVGIAQREQYKENIDVSSDGTSYGQWPAPRFCGMS